MPESQQPMDGINLVLQDILNSPDVNILDVGAGEGKWGKLLKGKVRQIDGIEVWKPYIIKYNLIPSYNTLYNVNMMNFQYGAIEYDVMILGDVLEHLKYNDAITFINEAKKHIKKIYLIIPISPCYQDGNYFGNPHESHLYQWTDDELKKLFDFKLMHEGYNPNGLVKIGTYIWNKTE